MCLRDAAIPADQATAADEAVTVTVTLITVMLSVMLMLVLLLIIHSAIS